MLFKQLFDEETSTLTYLLVDAVTRDAIIIDPVYGRTQRDLDALQAMNATLKYIVETHVHADHVTGAQALKKATNAGFVTGVGTDLLCSDILLGEDEVIHFGNEVLYAIPTPGHTNGCTTYRWRDRLFTGDALLINACGRTDFQQGNPSILYHSLEKILAYPNEYLIYPAHDYNGYRVSSVEQEKNNNPYIINVTENEFIHKMNNLELPNPHKIAVSVPANMQCGKVAA